MVKEHRTLEEVMKDINKKFESDAATIGLEDLTQFGTLSLRSPGLDYCLYNSLPERRIIELCGKEGSGKTTCAYLIAASFQDKERQRHPDNPRKILYVDLECTADRSWARKAGYDMSETADVPTVCLRPLDTPAEQILDMIKDLIRTNEIGLCIIDSLPMLVGEQIYEESFEKKEMGGIAKLLTTFTARITSMLVKYDCTLIGINQLRDNIGGYGLPYTTPGGNQWKFGCSVRLMLKKGAFLDENGNELTSNAESPAGYRMDMAVLKTKVCKWDRKIGSTYISYTDGVDILQDTIDIAVKLGIIDNSTQGMFKLIDPETGEVILDEEGKEIKVRGKKNVKPFLEERPELFRKIYDAVYEKISAKNDPNIIAFERLMNADVIEHNAFEELDLNNKGLGEM